MKKYSREFTSELFDEYWWLILISALFIYRILSLVIVDIPVFYDEAYYYSWSKDLAFGYFSKPPIVAWLIWLTSWLSTESWALRLASPILYLLASVFVWQTARFWFGEKSAKWSTVLFFSFPLIGFNSNFITTDAPLLAAWAASLYLLSKAFTLNRTRDWVLVGLISGIGLMSKYTMGLFLIGGIAFLCFSDRFKDFFYRKGPYLGAVVAFLCFLPNLLWNFENSFSSFEHTAEISQIDNGELDLGSVAEFLAAQLVCVGPWCLILFFGRRAPVSAAKDLSEEGAGLMWAMTLTLLITISLLALVGQANANWAAPLLISVSILMGTSVSQMTYRWKRVAFACAAANILILIVLHSYPSLLKTLNVEPTTKNNPYDRVDGWKEVIKKAQLIVSVPDDSLVLSNNRLVLSYMVLYNDLAISRLAAWNSDKTIDNHFELVADLADKTSEQIDGRTIYFVSRSELSPKILERFTNKKILSIVREPVYVDLERVLYIYRLSGFKGY